MGYTDPCLQLMAGSWSVRLHPHHHHDRHHHLFSLHPRTRPPSLNAQLTERHSFGERGRGAARKKTRDKRHSHRDRDRERREVIETSHGEKKTESRSQRGKQRPGSPLAALVERQTDSCAGCATSDLESTPGSLETPSSSSQHQAAEPGTGQVPGGRLDGRRRAEGRPHERRGDAARSRFFFPLAVRRALQVKVDLAD